MTGKRIFAIFTIFMVGVVGWFILGQANWIRSSSTSSILTKSVQSLWGTPIIQHSPKLTIKVPGTEQTRIISPSKNYVEAIINLEQRKKGLLWYPTYTVDFKGRYEVKNDAPIAQNIRLNFLLPSKNATYENVLLKIGNNTESLDNAIGYGFHRIIPLESGSSKTIEIQYRTRGIESWQYNLDAENGKVSGLDINLVTNFSDVDYVVGSLSPMKAVPTDSGLNINWSASELITNQNIGITLPQKLNPGPLAARMSFFAPICLLFFFVLITAICVTKKISIHSHALFICKCRFLCIPSIVCLFHRSHKCTSIIHYRFSDIYRTSHYLSLKSPGRCIPLENCSDWPIRLSGAIFLLVFYRGDDRINRNHCIHHNVSCSDENHLSNKLV